VAVEGRAQELDWSALCAPAKYENVVPLHGYTLTHKPTSRQIITPVVSLSEILVRIIYLPRPRSTPRSSRTVRCFAWLPVITACPCGSGSGAKQQAVLDDLDALGGL